VGEKDRWRIKREERKERWGNEALFSDQACKGDGRG
jgi:hypothetical protein